MASKTTTNGWSSIDTTSGVGGDIVKEFHDQLAAILDASNYVASSYIDVKCEFRFENPITITLAASDTNGIVVDGETNDFNVSGSAPVVLDLTRDIDWGSGNVADRAYVVQNQITHKSSGAQLGADTEHYVHLNIWDNDGTIENDTGANYAYQLWSFGNLIDDDGSYVASSGRVYVYVAGQSLTLRLDGTFSDPDGLAGGAQRYNNCGLSVLVDQDPTLSSGGLTSQAAGVNIDVRNTNVGNSSAVGLGISVSGGADAEWAIYQAVSGLASYHEGPIGVGSSAVPTANGGKVVWFGDNAAQPTPAANTTVFYGYDSGGGTVEAWVADESGNDTQLSAHGPRLYEPDQADRLPWVMRHRNRFLGIEHELDVTGALLTLQQMTGKTFVHERPLAKEDLLDWDEVQEQRRVAHARCRADRRAALQRTWVADTQEGVVQSAVVPLAEAIDLEDEKKWEPCHGTEPGAVPRFALAVTEDGAVDVIQAFARRVSTGRQIVRFRRGIRFDPNTGEFINRELIRHHRKQFYRHPTDEEIEATIAIEDGEDADHFEPKLPPDWIAERLGRKHA